MPAKLELKWRQLGTRRSPKQRLRASKRKLGTYEHRTRQSTGKWPASWRAIFVLARVSMVCKPLPKNQSLPSKSSATASRSLLLLAGPSRLSVSVRFTDAVIRRADKLWASGYSLRQLAVHLNLSLAQTNSLISRVRAKSSLFKRRNKKLTDKFNAVNRTQKAYDRGLSLAAASREGGLPYHLAIRLITRANRELKMGTLPASEVLKLWHHSPKLSYAELGRLAGVSKARAWSFCKRLIA